MKRGYLILIQIFLIVLAIRLYYSLQTPLFSDGSSFFALRQIEHIKETGLPFFQDTLSQGSRQVIFIPSFHYIFALFSFIFPTALVGKVLSNILAALLIIIVYFITKELTNDETSSLLAALFSGFIPVFIEVSINSISTYSLSIPLIFLALYFFMKIEDKKYLNYFIATIFILPLIHSSVVLLILGFIFYLLILKLESIKTEPREVETILFATFLVLWFEFIIYKKAFLSQGISLIWQNIPLEILKNYFSKTPIIEIIYKIGFVTFIFGAITSYHYIFKEKNKKIYLIIATVLAMVTLMWFRLVEFEIALVILGVLFAILTGVFYKNIFTQIKKTKLYSYKNLVFIIIIALFALTSLLPSFLYAENAIDKAPSDEEINAMLWLRENTNNTTVLTSTEEGDLVTAIAKRNNVIDSNFVLSEGADTRYNDAKRIYTTFYETEAVELLNKYNITYILFSRKSKKEFGIDKINYINNEDCFSVVYNSKETKIYESKCHVTQI